VTSPRRANSPFPLCILSSEPFFQLSTSKLCIHTPPLFQHGTPFLHLDIFLGILTRPFPLSTTFVPELLDLHSDLYYNSWTLRRWCFTLYPATWNSTLAYLRKYSLSLISSCPYLHSTPRAISSLHSLWYCHTYSRIARIPLHHISALHQTSPSTIMDFWFFFFPHFSDQSPLSWNCPPSLVSFCRITILEEIQVIQLNVDVCIDSHQVYSSPSRGFHEPQAGAWQLQSWKAICRNLGG
jgi:hypothetical protein